MTPKQALMKDLGNRSSESIQSAIDYYRSNKSKYTEAEQVRGDEILKAYCEELDGRRRG